MNEAGPDLGAMVSKLLGNPELISQIASTVGMDAPSEMPQGQAGGGEEGQAKTEQPAMPVSGSPAGGLDSILPMISMLGGKPGGSGSASRRCALLSALKPFCNEHRCKTIDYMIGISKLSDTFMPKRG